MDFFHLPFTLREKMLKWDVGISRFLFAVAIQCMPPTTEKGRKDIFSCTVQNFEGNPLKIV